MSVSMQLLWGMVNTLQLVIHMNMLTLIVPANVQFFFTFIVDIVNFKVFDVKPLINKVFGFKEDLKKKSDMPLEFQQTGYDSTNLMKNLGLLFIAIIGLVVIIAFVLLMRLLAKKIEIVNKIVTVISRKLFFNSILRALLEAYLKFSISTWISIKKLDFSTIDTYEEKINVVMTFLFLAVILIFPAFTYFILHKYKSKLEDEDFKGRFESIYLNVNTKIDKSILMMTLFVTRRLVYATAIVFLAG